MLHAVLKDSSKIVYHALACIYGDCSIRVYYALALYSISLIIIICMEIVLLEYITSIVYKVIVLLEYIKLR